MLVHDSERGVCEEKDAASTEVGRAFLFSFEGSYLHDDRLEYGRK